MLGAQQILIAKFDLICIIMSQEDVVLSTQFCYLDFQNKADIQSRILMTRLIQNCLNLVQSNLSIETAQGKHKKWSL